MKTSFFRKVNYIGWIVIILAFLFIYFTYFFVYIPKQKSDLTQRAFRILKEYGNNMVGKHDYYVTHFKNYGIFYSIKRCNELKLIDVKNPNNDDYKKIDSVVQDLFPYVTTDIVDKNIVDKNTDTAFFYSKKENKLLLNFYYQTPDTASLDKITGAYEITDKIKRQQSIESLLRDSAVNRVPIDKFMKDLQFDELFENIVLFDNSKVYYNSNLDNLVDITNPESLVDTTKNTQGGTYISLNIRGKEKHIMILPIDFDGKRFYIAGLITDTNFKSITQTFNNRVFILIAAILLLVFVGMPVLKTFFIGPKERLNSMDVSGSAVSILFGSALFVLIIIGLLKNQLVDRSELADRIHTISDSLNSYVNHDIDAIKSLGNSILQNDKSNPTPLADSVIKVFDSETSFFRDKSLKSPFPLNEIILIDSAGVVKKGYTRTAFSDAVDVNLSDRQYFRNAIDTNLAWPTIGNAHFYIESIQSYNTGEGETAISFHNSKFKNTAVLAITSKIPSLYYQVLPKDIEFVVIDKSGKVLYHSIQSKNLHENFIEECESDPGILNAIQLRVKDNIQIKYNEKKWLARIVPIEDTPLYHITLLDLNQTENKNARIFLITFYFLIGLQFVTIVSIFLLRFTFKATNNEPRVFRFLKWLAFIPSNYNVYKGLLVILGLIAAAGISSFIFQADLVNVLLLQFLSIGFTFYASLLFLKRKEITLNDYFKGRYFPENVIFAFIGIMVFVCIWKTESANTILIPLIILFITALIIPAVFRYFNRKVQINENKIPSLQKVKTAYLAVLFLWLAIFSVIPVVHSYFSVKHFEEKLWQQQQLFKMASDNLLLFDSKYDHDSPWFKRIQGNEIDSMEIYFKPFIKENESDSTESSISLTTSEKIYTSLPDPISVDYGQKELISGKNQKTEWILTDDSLHYSSGGQKGGVVIKAGEKSNAITDQFFLMALVFLLAALCIWQLVKFGATVFLNLNNEWPDVKNINWFDVFMNSANQRILLNSFNGDIFLKETVRILKNKKNDQKLEAVHAVQICNPVFNCESYLETSGKIIWINGLRECFPEIKNHKLLLDSLFKMNCDSDKKIVVDLPFEIELIDEFYDEFIASNELTSNELTDIFLLRKRWKNIFQNYIRYNGYLSQIESEEPETKLSEEHINQYRQNINREWFHSFIWKNLTIYEKIVLYDLADDGLMNRNNLKIIGQLTDKKLILIKPLPIIFDRDFREYIYQHISKLEIKKIEAKLGLTGNWRNAKYLILLILIPLAAFIFISQGFTIEKSFGIFVGIVGAITTLLKLFENSSIKK